MLPADVTKTVSRDICLLSYFALQKIHRCNDHLIKIDVNGAPNDTVDKYEINNHPISSILCYQTTYT